MWFSFTLLLLSSEPIFLFLWCLKTTFWDHSEKTSSLIFVICVLCISPTWMFWGYNMNEHNCLFEEKIASSVKKNLTPEANIMSLAFWSLDKLHLVNRVVVRMSHTVAPIRLYLATKSQIIDQQPPESLRNLGALLNCPWIWTFIYQLFASVSPEIWNPSCS